MTKKSKVRFQSERKDDKLWWVVDSTGQHLEMDCGGYDSKEECETARRGLERFFNDEV